MSDGKVVSLAAERQAQADVAIDELKLYLQDLLIELVSEVWNEGFYLQELHIEWDGDKDFTVKSRALVRGDDEEAKGD